VACVVVWGGIWDYGATARRRLAGTGEAASVTDYEASAMWFFGTSSHEELLEAAAHFTVRDLAPEVTCPLLIVHGQDDRQVSIDDDRKVYEAATGSDDVELRVFTREETSGALRDR
jgi:dipeptidyl aminopeptidase/acylaminoacyl peptidase